jgi:hypothetical protein
VGGEVKVIAVVEVAIVCGVVLDATGMELLGVAGEELGVRIGALVMLGVGVGVGVGRFEALDVA